MSEGYDLVSCYVLFRDDLLLGSIQWKVSIVLKLLFQFEKYF